MTVASPERDMIQRSLPFLWKDGIAWMEGKIPIQGGRKCLSCHQAPFALWSHHTALQKGFDIDEKALRERSLKAMHMVLDKAGSKDKLDTWSELLLGHAFQDDGELTAALPKVGELILEEQETDGHWRARGQLPDQGRDLMETNEASTMWTVLGLSALADSDAQAKTSIAKAKAWLNERPQGHTNEWYVGRLLLAAADGDREGMAKLAKGLRERQNDDGGWSWKPGQPSDAFATGQSLYALAKAGTAPADAAVREASRFLERTQNVGGTWTVPSRQICASPDENRDYVYTYWGTAWATLGLLETLPSEEGS